MRYNALFSITLAVRALASSFLTLAVWEMAHIVFEVYATQPIIVSHFAPSPNRCLLSGLQDKDPYIRVNKSSPLSLFQSLIQLADDRIDMGHSISLFWNYQSFR